MNKQLFQRAAFIAAATVSAYPNSAQTPFTNPTSSIYTIAYKGGTNCTASPYELHTIDLAGNITSSALATTPALTEVNAIGVNKDGFIYGIQYTLSSSCIPGNYHLYRYGQSGTPADLGTIAPPSGGIVGTAIGMVAPNNRYIFFAASGNKVGYIEGINALPSNPSGTLTPTYYNYTDTTTNANNIYPGYIINRADFAVNPLDGNLYSYGIYTGPANGTPAGAAYPTKGQVVKLDMFTKNVTLIGVANTTEFSDAGRDNFGGIMFGNDGYMYGIDVFTRNFYRINVNAGMGTVGTITYVATIPALAGQSQVRADLGSNILGNTSFALPVKLLSITGSPTAAGNQLSWLTTEEGFDAFEIQQSNDAATFTTCGRVSGGQYQANGAQRKYTWLSGDHASTYYRLKMFDASGHITYSSVTRIAQTAAAEAEVILYPNPAASQVKVILQGSFNAAQFSLINAQGHKVIHVHIPAAVTAIDVAAVPAGLYQAVLDQDGIRTIQRLVIFH